MSNNPFLEEIVIGPRIPLLANVFYVSGNGEPTVPAYVREAVAAQMDGTVPGDISAAGELLVFSSPVCSHCPMAVHGAVQVARANPAIEVIILDVQGHEEMASRLQIDSVPFTLMDRELAIPGILTGEELHLRLKARGTDAFGEWVLASLLETGRLDMAQHRMRSPAGLEAFATLWNKSATATRIGLMLLASEVLEEDARALDDVVSRVAPATRGTDAALRGDTADLLGQIAHPAAVELLKPLLSDPHPDVAEMAEEALDAIDDGGPR